MQCATGAAVRYTDKASPRRHEVQAQVAPETVRANESGVRGPVVVVADTVDRALTVVGEFL